MGIERLNDFFGASAAPSEKANLESSPATANRSRLRRDGADAAVDGLGLRFRTTWKFAGTPAYFTACRDPAPD